MQKKLNIKKTVETTLDRARGWILGKYPSSLNPDLDIKIDVRYDSSEEDSYNFSSKPSCVLIQRGTTRIALSRNSSISENGWEKPAYKITIFTPYREKYRIFETFNGKITKDEGNPFLLSAIQKDPDFNQYISFFSQNDHENTCISTQKWDLDKMNLNTHRVHFRY